MLPDNFKVAVHNADGYYKTLQLGQCRYFRMTSYRYNFYYHDKLRMKAADDYEISAISFEYHDDSVNQRSQEMYNVAVISDVSGRNTSISEDDIARIVKEALGEWEL